MRKLTLFFALVFATLAMAQVTTVPGIIQKGYDGEITIIFNPSEGNKGMIDAEQCYAHTGLITAASSSDGDWKHTIDDWRGTNTKGKMTKEGENWVLKMDNIYSFYNCPTDTEIKKIAFVFHDGPGGSKECKSASGSDIFVTLAEAGLAVNIANPLQEMTTVDTEVTLNCYATEEAELSLTLNGEVVKTVTGMELQYTYLFSEGGQYNFELTATNDNGTATATTSTWVPARGVKQNRPAGVVNGIYYDETDPTKVILCTYAGCKMAPSSTESSITVKAKMPAHWTNTITAWVWEAGADGQVIYPQKEGDWYVVTVETGALNIIFRNGTDWTTNKNQTEDITVTSNINIQLHQSGDNKATYEVLERDLVVKAKMPSHWTNTITALVTPDGGETKEVTPELKDGWYVFTQSCKQLTVVYRNGAASGDTNQSEPITLEENAMLQLTQEGTAKAVCNFVVADPAKHVFVVGDFNNWTISNDYQLKQANDSAYFWIELTGLEPQKEYALQYVVVRSDGQVKRISDLYSEKVLHPDDAHEPKTLDPWLKAYPQQGDGYVTVIQTDKPEYQWSEATLNFKRPDKNNLVIYEMWVYDYTPKRSLNAVLERMDYLKGLGVNAIELMPMAEFDGNYNWGYSPNHYFAFDKAYGTPEDMKAFVDACHKEGIAVIVDMVFNHATGLNPMNKLYPYGDDLKWNPWFNVNAPHSDNVYEDWNHDFAPTKTMFTRALQYWLNEYKVDGFRMDLSHGLCGTTNNALTHISDYYQNGVKAVAEDAYFILEHWGASAGDDWPKLINQGMMCWQNTSDAYHKAAAGSTGSSFSGANKRNYVSYCESHDEERMQYHARKSGVGNIKTDENVRLKRVAANVVFNVLLAGPHMIWQYEELGYDYSINSSETSPNSYSDGNRCTKKPRPETKGYFHHFVRMNQYTKIAQAIQLRTKLLADKFISLKQPSKATLGGVVRTIQWKDEVFVAGNFHASDEQVAKIPAGTWFDYYEQRPMTETEVVLAPGEFIILTGSEVALPEISTDFAFMSDVEDVIAPQPSEMLPPYNVRIYNINGQLMSQQTNAMSADLTGLNSGLYIVQYEKNGQRVAKKVIR